MAIELRPARREAIGRAVAAGLARRLSLASPSPGSQDAPLPRPDFRTAAPAGDPVDTRPTGVLQTSLPRRRQLAAHGYGGPPLRSQVILRASIGATLRRLGVWLRAALRFLAGTLADRLRGRDTVERRAVRLRLSIEKIGGTFLKLGQQMSTRLDLLPVPVCDELGKLLDRVPPIPVEQAVATIERVTRRPLTEVFARFDPEPIGSASIACVYQAELHDGRRVAVKVRRPGITALFAADWRALSWLSEIAEFLTLVHPGLLSGLVRDLEAMFLEEVDFRREARYTDMFRRRAERSRLRFITAPQVIFEISSEEVLVTELVAGVWLWELLWAVEHEAERGLAYVRSLNIDPVKVARRLFKASLFGIFEGLIFHADPHPANVVVRRDSEIVLIDFGSCGSYTETQLNIIRQFHYLQANEDIGGMVQCALNLLEPLPPVDVDEMTQEIETVFADSIHALKSRNSEWWERTSAGVWIGFLRVARKYGIRVNLSTLRIIRSTLLYDTLAARLYPGLDIYKEYRRYRRQLAAAAKSRVRRRIRRFFAEGIDDRTFLRWEEMTDLGQRILYNVHRQLDVPPHRFAYLAGKAAFTVSTIAHWAILTLTLGVAGVGILAGVNLLQGESSSLRDLIPQVATSGWFLGLAALTLAVNVRRMLLRFGDKDV